MRLVVCNDTAIGLEAVSSGFLRIYDTTMLEGYMKNTEKH